MKRTIQLEDGSTHGKITVLSCYGRQERLTYPKTFWYKTKCNCGAERDLPHYTVLKGGGCNKCRERKPTSRPKNKVGMALW